jgi:hypothetical protein
MNAIKTALSMYGAEEFSRIQRLYTMYGHTITGPDYIAFARPCREANHEEFTEDGHDAWFIELVVGSGRMDELIKKLPYHLPRIGWKRGFKGKDNVRFYDLDKLKTILTRY